MRVMRYRGQTLASPLARRTIDAASGYTQPGGRGGSLGSASVAAAGCVATIARYSRMRAPYAIHRTKPMTPGMIPRYGTKDASPQTAHAIPSPCAKPPVSSSSREANSARRDSVTVVTR